MVATVTPLLTLVHDCDAVSDWSGTPVFDNEIFIQGNGSLSKKVSSTTSVHMKPITSTDLTGRLIFAWMMCASVGVLANKVAGGLRIRIEDANAYWREWYVAGKDTYGGGWECFVVKADSDWTNQSTPAPTITAITKIGVVCTTTASVAKINFWWDVVRHGTGLRITGGTSEYPATWTDIFNIDDAIANKYGVISKIEGAFLVQGELIFGTTAADTATYFKDLNKIIIFRDRPFPDNFYRIRVEGNTSTPIAETHFYLGSKIGSEEDAVGVSGGIIQSATKKWTIEFNQANITAIGIYGTTIRNVGENNLGTSITEVISSIFDTCDTIVPGTSFIRRTTISSSSSVQALKFASTTNLKNSTFNYNTRAILIETAGEYEFNALIFNSNTKDIENASSGLVKIYNKFDSNAATYINTGGGTTQIITSATHILTGMKQYTEVTYVEVATGDVLFNVENVGADGKTEYPYDATVEKVVDIHIHHIEYVPILIAGITLTSAGGSIPITQYMDRVYANP